MPCYHPMQGYRSRADGKTIVFNPTHGWVDRPLTIPCGQCVGCRLERSRQWAVRCVHEASLHEDNCFITLTYNNESLPEDGSLNKKHFQDFMKRLRKKYKNKKIGSFGHSTIFSFHMAKVVSGIEGGCILTDNSKIASKLRSIRSHGDVSQYNSKFFGLNFRISDIHSSVVIEQLKKLDMFLEHRQNLAKLYKDELSNLVSFQSIPSFVTLHPGN